MKALVQDKFKDITKCKKVEEIFLSKNVLYTIDTYKI